MLPMKKDWNKAFYGTTTLGEKGQVVIPAQARQELHVAKGEKLLVFGMGKDMLVFSKLTNLERIASHLADRLEAIKALMKHSKSH
jgi:AbrB family looped-hinge helix DNA binding protein